MRSREYWKSRAIALEYYAQQDATKSLNKINRLFGTALENIDTEIENIRQELGKQTGIVSENELNELLSAAERDKSYRELQELLDVAETAEERIDIMNRINAQAYGARITRANSIGNKILAEFTKAVAQEKILCKELFSSTYVDAFYSNIYNLAEGYNAGVAFNVLPRRAINKALNEPWNSDNYSGRIWKHGQEFTEQVEETVIKGLMTGRSRAKLASELMDYTEHTRYVAERLVRTETAHFLGEGQRKAYEAAGIEKYRYLAALSERTCEVCAALDNKVFPLDEATEGVNYPTMHPNCRCVTITADAKLSTRLARDPETGKNYKVDGNMDFQQWKESLSDEQKQAFDLHVRQNKNKSSDKKQYDRYKARLGVDNLPKTFDKFQELKYTDVSKWEELKLAYKDKGLQEKIRRDYNLTVLEGKQGKHIIGHNNYIEGRSYITISVNDVQKLINEYAGTGSIDRDANGVWKNTETVETEKIIGVDVDNRTGQQTETNMFKIHYAKKGVHIVPKRK